MSAIPPQGSFNSHQQPSWKIFRLPSGVVGIHNMCFPFGVMMANFMCHLDWARGHLLRLSIIVGASVRVCPDGMNIESGLNKTDGPSQCR